MFSLKFLQLHGTSMTMQSSVNLDFWDSIRSLFPQWKVDDAAEGRRLAMMAMLPEWGEISEKEGTNGQATLDKINNVLYCMSRAEFENGGNFHPRIPDGFNAVQVSAF